MTAGLLLTLSLLGNPQAANLQRTFVTGQKDVYKVETHLQEQVRGGELETWLPSDLDIDYQFITKIIRVLPGGEAEVDYLRPPMTTIEGESADSGQTTEKEKTNHHYKLRVSPINEVLSEEEVVPPKEKWTATHVAAVRQRSLSAFLLSFVGDLVRLSIFVGSFENSLDMNPRFSLTPVKVGDTWKRTASYQPQKLKGAKKEMAVQRLDYTYVYDGPQTEDGKKFVQITMKLHIDTNLAPYANQLVEGGDSGLSTFPLKMDCTAVFKLDPKTLQTLSAEGHSTGFMSIWLKGQDTAVEELKFTGESSLERIATTK